MSRHKEQSGDFQPEENAVIWFGELTLAADRGNYDHAAECQRQLDRLGWRVSPKPCRQNRRQNAPREGVAVG